LHKTLTLVCASLLVAGCAPNLNEEVMPSFTDGMPDGAIGEMHTTVIRTFARTGTREDGRDKFTEYVDVPCSIRGEGYTAQIISPGQVSMPVFLGAPPVAAVTCSSGETQVTQALEPLDLTLEDGGNTGAMVGGGGILPMLIGRAIASSKPKEERRNSYGLTRVNLPAIPADGRTK